MEKIPKHVLDKVTGGDAPAVDVLKPGTSWLSLWKPFTVKLWQSPR